MEVKAKIDVSKNILQQFAEQLNLTTQENSANLESAIGTGAIDLTLLPNLLEVYHFKFSLKEPFYLQSFNPESSEWLLLNVNLSDSQVSKKVNDKEINIQKFLPSGLLLYTPKTEVYSVSPQDIPFEIVLIRFHKSILQLYDREKLSTLNNAESAMIYEDLDYTSEELLNKFLSVRDNTLLAHGYVLQFLSIFFDKLKDRANESVYEQLHSDDLKGLFMASAHLRNPVAKSIPSINELSKIAGMGSTKFKTTFKQIFGASPIRYNLKIKLEYAKDQLISRRSSPSEVSYEIGYSHPSKFTSAFKKHFGTLPSDI